MHTSTNTLLVHEPDKTEVRSCFFQKEHTKPIFNRLKLLTDQNLYKYHYVSEIFRIMKFRTTYSLYSTIDSSKRDTSNVIILSRKTNTIIYITSKLWNSIHKQILNENEEILTTSVSLVKLRCKTIILASQSINNNKNFFF